MKNKEFKRLKRLSARYDYLENPISVRMLLKISDFGCWLSRLANSFSDKIMDKAISEQDKVANQITNHPNYDEFIEAE